MDSHLNLANRLYEVVIGSLNAIQTWGAYLFDDDFNQREPELRNRVGTIWLCSMLDTLEADSSYIPQVIKESEASGFDSLVHNGKQLQNLCKLTSELLEIFTREEQIFLLDLRNQWVHGYLTNRHRDKISVKFSQNGKIVKEKIPNREYAEIIGIFYDKGTLDHTLQPMINKALSKHHRYWKSIGVLQNFNSEIYRILREGERFNITV